MAIIKQLADKDYVLEQIPLIDNTLTQEGAAADAKAVGDAINQISGGNVDLGVTGATVGQIIKVKTADENGKPTEWEAVDMPSGGGVTDYTKLENKPTETIGGDTLTWDGNTEGKTLVFDIGYKVSDVVPTLADVENGATMTLDNGVVIPSSGIVCVEEQGVLLFNVEGVAYAFVVHAFEDLPTGTYLAAFVSSLTIPGYTGFTKEVLKKEVLPEHTHTADDMSAVSYSAQTLTDEQKAQARANIGAGTSNVKSYNDLTDKPCGAGGVFRWDGDLTGKNLDYQFDTMGYCEVIPTGGTVPTYEDLTKGVTVTVYANDAVHVMEVPADGIRQKSNGSISIHPDGTYGYVVIDPSAGTMDFLFDSNPDAILYISEISVNGYNGFVSTLSENLLPESVESVIIRSSTEGSTKKFKLTIDDSGTISATEVS